MLGKNLNATTVALDTTNLRDRRNREQNAGMFEPGQQVRANLAGMRVGKVFFQAAVTDAPGTILRKTSETPPRYLVRLMFSFRGVDEVEVPEDRLKAA